MPGRGIAPKPRALKLVEGVRRDRINDKEPIPPKGDVKRPDWLSQSGRKAWRQIAPTLDKMGVLTTADPQALAMLCDAYGELIEARAIVSELGMTYTVTSIQMHEDGGTFEKVTHHPRPEVRIAQDAWKRCKVMFEQFGMTPAARSRIKVEPDVSLSKFESLLD